MSIRTEVTEMTEYDIRVQFSDIHCSVCGKSALSHGLHGSTWRRGDDACVWTWIGVVRTALADPKPKKRTT